MNKKMTDEEWASFMDAIPKGTVSPFGSYGDFLEREGVTTEDIQLWDTYDEIEKQRIKEESESTLLNIMVMLQDYEGLSPNDAVKKVHKQTASFADYPYSEQTILQLQKLGFTSEDDYPLPWQLKNRVEQYSDVIINDPVLFKEVQNIFNASTSANAATRQLIQQGSI